MGISDKLFGKKGESVHSNEEIIITSPISLKLVRVPAGEFLMGSDPTKDKDAIDREQPQHNVYLSEFYIGKYPVTNMQYETFVSAFTEWRPLPVLAPKHWEGGGNPGGKVPPGYQKHPVVNVYYDDAVRFCEWLRNETGKPFRLPTEAEWEKAARGTDGRIFPWGNEWDGSKLNSKEAGLGGTTQVGSYLAGESPYGALDMSGNVWDMCNSLMKPYPYKADDGREDMTSTREVIFRGGSFDFNRKHARCAYRETGYTSFCLDSAGFRVVVSMSKSTL
jgi:formylglycine-generating enzyme required for sulfatase activity